MSEKYLVEYTEELARIINGLSAPNRQIVNYPKKQRARNYLDYVIGVSNNGNANEYDGDFATYLSESGKIVVSPGTVIAGDLRKTTTTIELELKPSNYGIWLSAVPVDGELDFNITIADEPINTLRSYIERIAVVEYGKIKQVWKYGSIRICDRWV